MSRSQPYRNRIPTHIIKLLDVSSRITLFLVGQNGPLSFIFKDRLQNKYKTSIGTEIKCSCSNNKNDHCIHSLYVLLRIFKISIDNPIIWQASFLDSELSDIVAGKYTVSKVRKSNRIDYNVQNEGPQLSTYFLKKKQLKLKPSFNEAKVQRMSIQEDSTCPICQQAVKKSQCLTYCKIGCGNNYHLQCLKVWVFHKKSEQSKITCPMCRQQFHSNIFDQLKQQQMEFKKKQVLKKSFKSKCSGCGLDQIVNNTHKCVLCENFQLCEPCYMSNKHLKHPFIKLNQNGQWQAADERRTGQLKVKEFIEHKRSQRTSKQIVQKMRAIQNSSSNLLNYICSAYPYVSKYISDNIDPYKKLNLQPQLMQCQKCGSCRMIFLRRLPCGHFIDHQCLKQNIRNGILYCSKDGDKLIKGYENLIQKQKNIQYQNQKVQLQIHNQFNPNHLELIEENQQQSYNFTPNSINLNLLRIAEENISNSEQEQRTGARITHYQKEGLLNNPRRTLNRPHHSQRQSSNQINISRFISRKFSQSKNGLLLNKVFISNFGNQAQKRASYFLNHQVERQESRRRIDEKIRRLGQIEIVNKKLPSLSGQRKEKKDWL